MQRRAAGVFRKTTRAAIICLREIAVQSDGENLRPVERDVTAFDTELLPVLFMKPAHERFLLGRGHVVVKPPEQDVVSFHGQARF